MKKNEEDIILYHKKKRRKHKIKLAIIATTLIVFSLILIGIYCIYNKKQSINYKENSKVNYGVNLIENEFYENNYIDEGIDIISGLIKNINVNFNYNLDIDEEIEYKYSYKLLAETQVKEKSKTNSIYEKKEEIINKAEQSGKSKRLVITEKLNLDYNKYNDEIKKLVDAYKLANTTSELHLNLYLNVTDKATGKKLNKEDNVMSLIVPLTTKTVEITVNENVKNNQGEIILQQGQNQNTKYILFLASIMLLIGIITLVKLVKYISDTRSAEKMYEDDLKKILFDYKSYVQKVNNKIDYEDYKLIKIDTFNELIEMREEVQASILMYIEENIRKTTFMMINGNLLFEYILSAEQIREELIKRSKEREGKRKHAKNK